VPRIVDAWADFSRWSAISGGLAAIPTRVGRDTTTFPTLAYGRSCGHFALQFTKDDLEALGLVLVGDRIYASSPTIAADCSRSAAWCVALGRMCPPTSEGADAIEKGRSMAPASTAVSLKAG
jgi:hypothetical protein